ncbi:MAG: fibronectin type III domain-containing protein [bacterium]|jgi:hypothetical protein
MKLTGARLWLAALMFALAMAGCGSVGDPKPPSLEIPQRIDDLGAVQRGDAIIVTFTAPSQATDGAPLRRFEEVDLRAGPPDAWEERAARIDAKVDGPGLVKVELPALQWAGREVLIRVRLAGRKGRFSDWSNAIHLKPMPPLEAPSGVRAEATAAGVRLNWKAPGGTSFRVFRRVSGQGEPELIGTAEKSEFIDTAARFGTPYEYFVQAFAKAGDAEAFSEQSTAVEVTPRDIFPPAPPAGLMATPGAAAIQLTWSPNSESDLAGYRVYRSAGGAFERVADALPTPFYADRDVKAGVSYRYSVSAFDQGGNESARTDPVEATAQ